MTIFDLVFILTFLGCIVALLLLCYFLIRRQWRRAKRLLLVAGCVLALYALTLLSVALLSPQHVIAAHQDRCFDDWCISVEQARQQATVGASPTVATAHGMFYLVTVRVTSLARGISQSAPDAVVYLLDANGQRYDPSEAGQQALDATGQGGLSLNSKLAPSSSFTRTVVFDLPKGASQLSLVINHGLFPEIMIIGSEQSFLHKPTIFQFPVPCCSTN